MTSAVTATLSYDVRRTVVTPPWAARSLRPRSSVNLSLASGRQWEYGRSRWSNDKRREAVGVLYRSVSSSDRMTKLESMQRSLPLATAVDTGLRQKEACRPVAVRRVRERSDLEAEDAVRTLRRSPNRSWATL